MEHIPGLTVNQLIINSLPLLEPDDPVKYIQQNDITLHVPTLSWSYKPSQPFYHHNLLDIRVSADGIASLTLDHTVFKHNQTAAIKSDQCFCLHYSKNRVSTDSYMFWRHAAADILLTSVCFRKCQYMGSSETSKYLKLPYANAGNISTLNSVQMSIKHHSLFYIYYVYVYCWTRILHYCSVFLDMTLDWWS
jgi:hypothetical protein